MVFFFVVFMGINISIWIYGYRYLWASIKGSSSQMAVGRLRGPCLTASCVLDGGVLDGGLVAAVSKKVVDNAVSKRSWARGNTGQAAA